MATNVNAVPGVINPPWDWEIETAAKRAEEIIGILNDLTDEVSKKQHSIRMLEARREFWTRVKEVVEADPEAMRLLDIYVRLQVADPY
jgi:hypothetical protein